MIADRLEERISELERRATRYRNALVLLVLGMCAVAVVGATTDDGVIRGKILRLTNDDGQTVVIARADQFGNGAISAANADGQMLLMAGASGGKSGMLVIRSPMGETVFSVGSNPLTGNGTLSLNSNSGITMFRANGDTNGNGGIRVNAGTGKPRAMIATDENTGFVFYGMNKTDETVVSLTVDEYGSGHVYAGNRKGEGFELTPAP
jgi:hypothetical protein